MKVKVSFEIGDVVTHKASYNPLVVIGSEGSEILCRYYVDSPGDYRVATFIPEELLIEGCEINIPPFTAELIKKK